ncbi:hypothetical protein AM596_15180 [Clostridium perfringens CP4]|uniref:hypothetical protein n=1 Tax=Clostridium perfringens TaxID=1502 RepID=UPI00070725E8|nr:hypothetical protein [Clostridium perfringens]KQC91371.1 hypothetical protein AM596_15180 [Clostridium perfringens CP4]
MGIYFINEGSEELNVELQKRTEEVNKLVDKNNESLSEAIKTTNAYGEKLKQGTENIELQYANKLNEAEKSMQNINMMAQLSLPAKQGISTNSNKLIIKNTNTNINVVQKSNNGYLLYEFWSGRGDGSSASVGGTYELLRLKSVEQILDCIVWKEPNVISGNLIKSIAASNFNPVDEYLVEKNTDDNFSNNIGLSLYDINVGESVEFREITNSNPISNLLYLSNTNRSENIVISINGVEVTQFSSNKGYVNGHYITKEFEVPSSQTSSIEYTIKIENKGTKKFSFCCFNFCRLKDFGGQSVDSYKIYRLKKYFINADGSSDYAISDKDLNKWCGSFHGGETRLNYKMSWNNTKFGMNKYNTEVDIKDVSDGSFTLMNSFRINQITNINDKAKMTSIFDFDIDGTLNMNFGLSENSIKAKDIYTSLTCTHPDFKFISYPILKATTENGNTNLEIQNGYVEQYSNDFSRKLGIRYTMFNNFYNKLGTYIFSNNNYSKVYYGIVSGYSEGVVLPSVTFSKSLDFYNLIL